MICSPNIIRTSGGKTAALKQALQAYSSSPLVLSFLTFVLIHDTYFICIYQKFHSSIMEIHGNYLAFPSFKSFSRLSRRVRNYLVCDLRMRGKNFATSDILIGTNFRFLMSKSIFQEFGS